MVAYKKTKKRECPHSAVQDKANLPWSTSQVMHRLFSFSSKNSTPWKFNIKKIRSNDAVTRAPYCWRGSFIIHHNKALQFLSTILTKSTWATQKNHMVCKICLQAKWPIRPVLNSSFSRILKWLSTPPGWDASPLQGNPQHYDCQYPFIHLSEERQCGVEFLL